MNKHKDTFLTYDLLYYEEKTISRHSQDLVREEPLSIKVENMPHSVVMRTPGYETAHTAGFCYSEGLIESGSDIVSIDFSSEDNNNSVTVKLTDKRKKIISNKTKKRLFLSQTNCAKSGHEMLNDLINNLNTVDKKSEITYSQVIDCVVKFTEVQEFYTRTRGTHAVMLFNGSLDIIAKAEDVGRHNAMDKAIGTLVLDDKLSDIYLAVISSRISFEMMQKAARAGIPILISFSNPTSMAVELGLKLNMTLISLNKKNSGFIVSCCEHRIKTSE
ncbi:MAG: formate dehydrogenase accessory sulfurtransferase FdhD [Spirochaetes bacterium]|nr:formate dehydrogenase accessory sulfurtransferase FdhD [Spirochaetota bacterium]